MGKTESTSTGERNLALGSFSWLHYTTQEQALMMEKIQGGGLARELQVARGGRVGKEEAEAEL